MKFNRDMLLLYAITDRSYTGKHSLYEQIESALKGGVTMLQLREKNLGEEDFIKEAKLVKDLCHRYGVPLIINDNVRVALKSGADGIHVGASDTPVSEIRKICGSDFIIGATAKTVSQAQFAQKEGADYIGAGAVFPSPTKNNALRITGEQLDKICSSVTIPAVAIGGITIDNAEEIKCGNIAGIAVISAVFAADDITEAAKRLKEKAMKISKL